MADSTGAGQEKPAPLRSDKVRIETSQGTLFARELIGSDLIGLEPLIPPDEEAPLNVERLGKAVLAIAVGTSEQGEDAEPLSTQVLTSLTEHDISSIAAGIAEANGVELEDGHSYLALGTALAPSLTTLVKSARHLKERGLGLDISKAFPNIGTATGEALGKSLSVISDLREKVRATSAFQQLAAGSRLLTRQDILNAPLGVTGLGTTGLTASEMARRALADINPLQSAMDAMNLGAPHRTVESAMEYARRAVEQQESLERLMNPGGVLQQADLYSQPSYEIPAYIPPPISETPIGRAAEASEESARQLREVAQVTAAMADGVGALTQAIVSKAIPEWLSKLASDRESETVSLRQANSSLRWTKWTLIVSALLTVAMTGWQLYVGKQYKEASDIGQAATDKAVADQLSETRRTNELLRQEIEALKAQASAQAAKPARAVKSAGHAASM